MLAAIVPHAGAAWFFKLAGPADAVGKHAEAFDTLIKSVTFPRSTEAKPQVDICPPGWKQTSGGADLRFATLTDLRKAAAGSHRYHVALVAGARSGATPVEPEPLARPDDAQAAWTRSIWPTNPFDQARRRRSDPGRFSRHARSPAACSRPLPPRPNATETGAAKSSLPAGHPPIADAKTEIAQADKNSGAAKPINRNCPFTFDAPERLDCVEAAAVRRRRLHRQKRFARSANHHQPTRRGAGGLLSNVNRWRAQLKLPEISEDELNSLVKPYQVDGKPAQMVQVGRAGGSLAAAGNYGRDVRSRRRHLVLPHARRR